MVVISFCWFIISLLTRKENDGLERSSAWLGKFHYLNNLKSAGMKKILFGFSLFWIGFNSASAQSTANFTASVTIVQPINIATTSNLNFASLEARTGGAVILTPEDVRTSSGGVELKEEANLSAATFEITGQQDFAFSINLPDGEFELTNGSHKMIIRDFTSNLSQDTYLGDGKKILKLGATLDVSPDQASGQYTSLGALTVTVNYN